jgi:hypothetical protein
MSYVGGTNLIIVGQNQWGLAMTSEQLTSGPPPVKPPVPPSLKKLIVPAVYLIAAGIATLGWFYALGRGALVLVGWVFS